MSRRSALTHLNGNLPGEEGPGGRTAGQAPAVVSERPSERTHRAMSPARRGENSSILVESEVDDCQVLRRLERRYVEQAHWNGPTLRAPDPISSRPSAAGRRAVPRVPLILTYRYLPVLIPIEDLIERLSARQRSLVLQYFGIIDCIFSRLVVGPTEQNTPKDQHPRGARADGEIDLAIKQLKALDPLRFQHFRQNLRDDLHDLRLHSMYSADRRAALDVLLDRLGLTHMSELLPNHPHRATPHCSLCFMKYPPDTSAVVLPCNPTHHFHPICIHRQLRKRPFCPICETRTLIPRDY
ncbi:hypothetical protein PGT21_013111 [Puccinia graminis f. sp. tritici]|uniref:RING-type domain-containing protein n=1 Tax=Puccinia graminis f. sp. tritici TaxID=56615 RepID=A0A5B0QTC0_PUCGR|nr:hypothetical protein PGT21_013111 [Puccinia graminis f. sp. tritici]